MYFRFWAVGASLAGAMEIFLAPVMPLGSVLLIDAQVLLEFWLDAACAGATRAGWALGEGDAAVAGGGVKTLAGASGGDGRVVNELACAFNGVIGAGGAIEYPEVAE